jgi:hypothetical protein
VTESGRVEARHTESERSAWDYTVGFFLRPQLLTHFEFDFCNSSRTPAQPLRPTPRHAPTLVVAEQLIELRMNGPLAHPFAQRTQTHAGSTSASSIHLLLALAGPLTHIHIAGHWSAPYSRSMQVTCRSPLHVLRPALRWMVIPPPSTSCRRAADRASPERSPPPHTSTPLHHTGQYWIDALFTYTQTHAGSVAASLTRTGRTLY